MDFGDQIAAFAEKTEDKISVAVRKISLELFSRVILKTPVDTGRLRGNWQVAVGSIPEGTLEVEDKAGTITISAADAATAGVQAGDVVYLANNLPYAQRIEDGHSSRAPQGMVALSIQEFQRIAEQIGFELIQI